MEASSSKKERQVILHDWGNLLSVPEGCIAAIAAFTTPRDACRLALVSRDFKSVSDSDIVWERFLPSDCDLIAARSDGGVTVLADFPNKKELYMRLADHPLLIDVSTKSFWLDKSSGKKCWMLSAGSLTIIWSDTPRYWKWTSVPESRFREVAELLGVCWLEIRGKIRYSMLSPGIHYAAYLVYRMTGESYGLHTVTEASVGTFGGQTETRSVHFSSEYEQLLVHRRYSSTHEGFNRPRLTPFEYIQGPTINSLCSSRTDGWQELKIGEFLALSEEEDEVELSVLETKTGNWKTGLVVEGIEVRPI